jgi:dimethylglycine dehydrogenase
MRDGKVVGTVSSGGWGHRTGKNIAYAFVVPSLSAHGTQLEIDVLGHIVAAQITDQALYDPQMTRPRG